MALSLALLPLVTGLAIFFTWWATGWRELEAAGAVDLFVGVGLVGVAVALVLADASQERRVPRELRANVAGRIASVLGVTVACFVACGLVISWVLEIDAARQQRAAPVVVIVRNATSAPLAAARFAGVLEADCGFVPAAGAVELRYPRGDEAWSSEAGPLELEGFWGDERRTWCVTDRYEFTGGDTLRVLLQPSGEVELDVRPFDPGFLD
ncbi:MAG: hypothetical protein H6828_02760 [Planctomycetes bacterium]|nr:hypothetical protein [Planctomycetota bacterium]